MKSINYIYIAVAVALAIGIIGAAGLSSHRIRTLEKAVGEAKRVAAESQNTALQKEQEAEVYKAKIEYLEQQFADIDATARKQDEKLKTQTTNTVRARADVERAKRARPNGTTADELCARLAELGHECRQ